MEYDHGLQRLTGTWTTMPAHEKHDFVARKGWVKMNYRFAAVFLGSVCLGTVIAYVILSRPISPCASNANKVYSTSFEDASVKDSATLNLYNGLKNNIHVQGGGLFWVEDSINPTSEAPRPHTGTKSIGLKCPAGTGTRRSELILTHMDESGILNFPSKEAYFSIWYFLPSNWELNGLGYNWCSICCPFMLYADGSPYPATAVHIHNVDGTADIYDLTMEYDISSSWGWHNVLGKIDNFQVPKGVWFQMKWYIYRSATNGLLKCWINAPPTYDNVLWVNVSSYGLMTDVVGKSAWVTSIAKIYTDSDDGGTTADLSLWVDDLEVWSCEPRSLTWSPYQVLIMLETKNSQPMRLRSLLQRLCGCPWFSMR
jgi:hypothetical protein